MTDSDEDLLAILILSHKHFVNSYDLCKVLAWKFHIINCSEIIKRIEAKGHIITTYPKSKTLEHFTLTFDGKKVLQEEISSLIGLLKNEFPDEIEFINKLSSYE